MSILTHKDTKAITEVMTGQTGSFETPRVQEQRLA